MTGDWEIFASSSSWTAGRGGTGGEPGVIDVGIPGPAFYPLITVQQIVPHAPTYFALSVDAVSSEQVRHQIRAPKNSHEAIRRSK